MEKTSKEEETEGVVVIAGGNIETRDVPEGGNGYFFTSGSNILDEEEEEGDEDLFQEVGKNEINEEIPVATKIEGVLVAVDDDGTSNGTGFHVDDDEEEETIMQNPVHTFPLHSVDAMQPVEMMAFFTV